MKLGKRAREGIWATEEVFITWPVLVALDLDREMRVEADM